MTITTTTGISIGQHNNLDLLPTEHGKANSSAPGKTEVGGNALVPLAGGAQASITHPRGQAQSPAGITLGGDGQPNIFPAGLAATLKEMQHALGASSEQSVQVLDSPLSTKAETAVSSFELKLPAYLRTLRAGTKDAPQIEPLLNATKQLQDLCNKREALLNEAEEAKHSAYDSDDDWRRDGNSAGSSLKIEKMLKVNLMEIAKQKDMLLRTLERSMAL